MRFGLALLSVLFVFASFGQTERERAIYEDSISTAVVKSSYEVVYYGTNDKVVGYRLISKTDTNYTDARKRSIVKRPIKNTKSEDTVSKPKENEASKSSTNRSLDNVDQSRLTKIIRFNKIIYKYPDGSRAYTVRRHWWNKKRVTYFDADGKRIGFKKQKNNGEVVYFDSRGRRTGESFINASGQLVFRPEFQRETPGIMLTQFFFE